MESRAKHELHCGDQVLVITCPVLSASLLKHWLGEEMMTQLLVNGELTSLLDQMEQGNEQHGILIGSVSSIGEARPSGLFPVEVDTSDEIVMLTRDELERTSAELEAFEARYPYLIKPRTGDGDIGSLLLGMMARNENPMPDEDTHDRWWTRYVPLPDDVFNSLKVSDDLDLVILLDPEGFEEMVMEVYHEGNDPELIRAVDAEDVDAVLARIKAMQKEKASTPFALTLPDTAAFREMVQMTWSATLERVQSDCAARLRDMQHRF